MVTKALFAQRDFTDMTILEDFHTSLELGLRSQLTESGLYMGASFDLYISMLPFIVVSIGTSLYVVPRINAYTHAKYCE